MSGEIDEVAIAHGHWGAIAILNVLAEVLIANRLVSAEDLAAMIRAKRADVLPDFPGAEPIFRLFLHPLEDGRRMAARRLLEAEPGGEA